MSERIAQGAQNAAARLESVSKNAAGIVNDKSPSALDLALRIAELCGQISEGVGAALEKSDEAKSGLANTVEESRTALNALRSAGINNERAPMIFSTAQGADDEIAAALGLIKPPERNLAELRDLAGTMRESFGQVAGVLQNGEADVATGGVAQVVARIQGLAAEGAASGANYANNLRGGS